MIRTSSSPFRRESTAERGRESTAERGRESTAERDGFWTPALAVSIAIAIFAVVTQLLAATGAISLSTTQQLTMWLVAAGLIVLLWIAYMAVQAQARLGTALEATAAAERDALAARNAADERAAKAEQAAAGRTAAAGRGDPEASTKSRAAEAESRDAWVPPDELRRLDGPRRSVATADVFPDGCYLYRIREAKDYDEETDIGGLVDISPPRRRIYRCAVVDLNPVLRDRPHDATVDVETDQELSPPPGVRHPLVEFDGLTITPYVTDRGPIWMGYALRATDIRFVAGEVEAAS
jgi:hypothetical protein